MWCVELCDWGGCNGDYDARNRIGGIYSPSKQRKVGSSRHVGSQVDSASPLRKEVVVPVILLMAADLRRACGGFLVVRAVWVWRRERCWFVVMQETGWVGC